MKKIVHTASAPEPIGPYNQAVWGGETLYVSGQIALPPGQSDLIQNSLEAETEQVMQNLRAVLEAAGSSLAGVLKCTIFLTDMGDFEAVNAVYASYFPAENAPAREAVAVAALPKGARVEISCIAQAQ